MDAVSERPNTTHARSRQAPIAVAALVLGLMLALQLRTHRAVDNIDMARSQELATILRMTEKERNALREEVADLRNKLAAALEGNKALSTIQGELDKARLLAGLVAVSGPGISLVLDDSKLVKQKGDDPNVFLLHDDDILKVVNEIAAAGAEAMAINGQRVIATTEIRCAGPTISVNNTRVAPPIQILAIGDPVIMESSLKMRGGVLETLSVWGIEARLRREAEVTIPAYKGVLQFRNARVKGGP
jgi:uncharacterized protein YlxW (UPF0749 family)